MHFWRKDEVIELLKACDLLTCRQLNDAGINLELCMTINSFQSEISIKDLYSIRLSQQFQRPLELSKLNKQFQRSLDFTLSQKFFKDFEDSVSSSKDLNNSKTSNIQLGVAKLSKTFNLNSLSFLKVDYNFKPFPSN